MYLRPAKLDDALKALAEPGRRVLAGGTDVFPAQGDRQLTGALIDISGIDELSRIERREGCIRFGGGVTWSTLLRHPLPRAFDGLKAAAREIGSVQIQNTGTIAGNLCNASPAADGVPALLVLDAVLEIASLANGVRRLPLQQFITGYRQTTLAPGEIVTAIEIPDTIDGPSCFLKLGTRRYLVISIAMVAVVIEARDGAIAKARIAVGACSPVAQRQPDAEAALVGQPCTPATARQIEDSHLTGLAPIDDVRATAGYRREAALTLVRRAIAQLTAGG
ncbi:MAG: xanthine dehydrogenase family protein subunit M [Hyphomicrobiaceae bacterium]